MEHLVALFATSRIGLRVELLVLRSTGHSIVSRAFATLAGTPYRRPMVVTTIGRRSGRRHSVVLPHSERPGHADSLILIGSKRGARSDPDWVRNLRANPQVEITYRKRARAGQARELNGDERDEVWTATKARAKIYAEYEAAAAPRTIPVVEVRLEA